MRGRRCRKSAVRGVAAIGDPQDIGVRPAIVVEMPHGVAEQRARIETAIGALVVGKAGEAQRPVDGSARRPADEQGDGRRDAGDACARRSKLPRCKRRAGEGLRAYELLFLDPWYRHPWYRRRAAIKAVIADSARRVKPRAPQRPGRTSAAVSCRVAASTEFCSCNRTNSFVNMLIVALTERMGRSPVV